MPASKAQALIAEAERQLAIAQVVDYEAPARTRRFDARNKAAELYRQACELHVGAEPCVWAVSLIADTDEADPDSQQRIAAATDVLATMCLDQKDDDACRLFDADDVQDHHNFSDPAALCARGLADACSAAATMGPDPESLSFAQRACDLGSRRGCLRWKSYLRQSLSSTDSPADLFATIVAKQLRAEVARCARGFGLSCVAMVINVDGHHPRTPDTPAREQHAEKVLAEGCRRGYLFECEYHDELHVRECSLTGRRCGSIARYNGQLSVEPTAIRDVLEHGCQFRVESDCIDLVKGYRSQRFPEPVPDRAKAIRAYVCPVVPGNDFDRLCKELHEP